MMPATPAMVPITVPAISPMDSLELDPFPFVPAPDEPSDPTRRHRLAACLCVGPSPPADRTDHSPGALASSYPLGTSAAARGLPWASQKLTNVSKACWARSLPQPAFTQAQVAPIAV